MYIAKPIKFFGGKLVWGSLDRLTHGTRWYILDHNRCLDRVTNVSQNMRNMRKFEIKNPEKMGKNIMRIRLLTEGL